MARGRQTKIVARAAINASVIDIHGKQVIQWSVTKPLDVKSEKLVMQTSYNGDMQSAIVEVSNWLSKHFKDAA